MHKFTADFETSTPAWLLKDDKTRVWAYSICEIGNPDNFIYGTSIDDFMKWCQNKKQNYELYFHNLKFDGEYIFSYLLNNGYEVIKNKKERRDKTFTTLISDMGQFYSIEIFFDTSNPKHINKVTIYDSQKILNMSVDKIAKDFNLPIRKLELDYDTYREVDHVLTPHEIDYIRNDVEIMARALDIMFNENLTKMTIGSDALSDYKKVNQNFKHYYPILNYEIDKDIRKSYKGGFTYLNPLYKEKETGCGIVLDVNSLYPSVMMYERLPFGDPVYFEGKYEEDLLYPLYVQTLTCSFELKKGKIPSIQIKNNLSFLPNEYVESSNGDIVTLTLTNIDLELFFMQYDVYDITYYAGWKFKAIKGLFTEYINKWSAKKIEAKKEGNGALYKISKLMLNSLYGKFGLNPDIRSKYPYLSEDKSIHYKMYEAEIREAIYIPVASFITSYARRKTITTSQKIREYSIKKYNKDCYVYSDTDSIHCTFNSYTDEKGDVRLYPENEDLYDMVDIDDFRLGAWKVESRYVRGKYIRQKCYIEKGYDDKMNVTVAGLPKDLGQYVNFDNFKKGLELSKNNKDIKHKLTFKHIEGGVLLVPTDFSIK